MSSITSLAFIYLITRSLYHIQVILSFSILCLAAATSLQSCLTLCDPMHGSPPGSPVPGILQARTLEWVAISFSNAWKWKVKVKVNSLSRVRLFETPWTAAYQAPLPMGFSRQEYWSGVPLPSPFTAWDPLNSRALQNLGPWIVPLPFPYPGLRLFLLGSSRQTHSLEMCIFPQEGCWGLQHIHWVPGSAVPGHGQSPSSPEPTASSN